MPCGVQESMKGLLFVEVSFIVFKDAA